MWLVLTEPPVVILADQGFMGDVADLNAVNFLGQTALHKAASGGEIELVEFLIKAGAEIEVTDRKGQTPLFSAVFSRQKETAQLLLKYGADPEGSPKNLNTPISITIMHKDVEMLKLLLDYNASPSMTFSNSSVCAPHFLLTTTVDGLVCFDLMKLLLLHGCDIDYNPVTGRKMDMSPLFACIFFLKPRAILVLLCEFGCQRWDFNWRDDRLYDTRGDGGSIKSFVMEKAASPPTLMSTCRVYLYRALQKKPLQFVHRLPLPPLLKDYLEFKDLQFF